MVNVPGGERVPDGRHGLSGLVVPAAGAAVQLRHVIPLLEQMCPQDVSEEVVVAVPAAMVIKWHHEQVLALE